MMAAMSRDHLADLLTAPGAALGACRRAVLGGARLFRVFDPIRQGVAETFRRLPDM